MILTVVNPATPAEAAILAIAAFVGIILLGQLARYMVIGQ